MWTWEKMAAAVRVDSPFLLKNGFLRACMMAVCSCGRDQRQMLEMVLLYGIMHTDMVPQADGLRWCDRGGLGALLLASTDSVGHMPAGLPTSRLRFL